MIYVTGDVHGQIARFKEKDLKVLKKTDTLIILGDFGFLWDGSQEEQKNLKWLTNRPYRVLFLDGCHENFTMLGQYPEQELWGGRVQALGGNLYHVCRGSVLQLENRTFFCMGGGASEDIEDRDEGINWWREETPSPQELEQARRNLQSYDWKVDYILTHDAPGNILEFMGHKGRQGEQRSSVQVFLNELNTKVQYSQWVFARYHEDRRLGQKMQEVFGRLIQLETEPPARKGWIFRKKDKKEES